jgi:tetratricopeptide (TPR) repeat protein
MIKNESKIIERCLTSALEHINAIFILDTGSTDNTIEVCHTLLKNKNIPYKIEESSFKNFGYNRTISFERAKEFCKDLQWELDNMYAFTIDADMIIKPSNTFKDIKLVEPGYNILQKDTSLKYYNLRLLSFKYDWKSIGSTHEYWECDTSADTKFSSDVIYIKDINDGGCKSDKTTRDIQLLENDLIENSNNERSIFYLALSYKENGNYKEAIRMFKKRIQLEGWEEEVWYSKYQIAKCYEKLNQPEKVELWINRAFQYKQDRLEPLHFYLQYLKEQKEYFKAYEYYLKGKDIKYPTNDILFIEDIYDGAFELEKTMLNFFIFTKTKQDCLKELIDYINTYSNTKNQDICYYNSRSYINSLISPIYRGQYNRYWFPQYNEYQASSCSILPYNGGFIMNVRYVNYLLDQSGKYNIQSNDNIVRTKNYVTFLNTSYNPVYNTMLMNEIIEKTYTSDIEGLEDIRLFYFKNKIHFSASTKNLSEAGKINIALGEYCLEDHTIRNVHVIEPPYESTCEKNWIYIPKMQSNKMNFIYKWHPLEIGSINDVNKLEIHTKYDTPSFFRELRGSSNVCEYDGRLWCAVHYVKPTLQSRIYYHLVVSFNRETFKPEMYSLPFVFCNTSIEYCLGFNIKDSNACFIISQNDTEPAHITVSLLNLKFISI